MYANLPLLSLCCVISTPIIVPVMLQVSAKHHEVNSCSEKQVSHEPGLCALSHSFDKITLAYEEEYCDHTHQKTQCSSQTSHQCQQPYLVYIHVGTVAEGATGLLVKLMLIHSLLDHCFYCCSIARLIDLHIYNVHINCSSEFTYPKS